MDVEAGWWRKALAELVGAFALVVGGAGSVLAATAAPGQPVILFAAFGHAFTIAVMGTALAPISGGQISPAVTLGLVATRRLKPDLGFVIILFQLLGSVLGGYVLLALWPQYSDAPLHLATPAVTDITPVQAALLEALMTFLLVFVVFATAIDPRGAAKTLGALPIGLTVGVDWLFGGYFTGAAMSPGRWIGPAVASGFFDNAWVYWVGPLLGGMIAALLYDWLFMPRGPKT